MRKRGRRRCLRQNHSFVASTSFTVGTELDARRHDVDGPVVPARPRGEIFVADGDHVGQFANRLCLRRKLEESKRVIGREGRTVKAIRSVLFAAGQNQGKRFHLDLVED